jgi:nitrogen fixation NifU-like protein
MSELNELYNDLITEHARKPRNFRTLTGTCRHREGYNPLCGDRFTVYLQMEGDTIKDVSFQGKGCAISTASASLMTEALKGKTPKEAAALFSEFHDLLTGKTDPLEADEALGKLLAFGGVSHFPVRVKCASLPWHTLRSALGDEDAGPVTTE